MLNVVSEWFHSLTKVGVTLGTLEQIVETKESLFWSLYIQVCLEKSYVGFFFFFFFFFE